MEHHNAWVLQSALMLILIFLSIFLIYSLHTTNESVEYIRKSFSSNNQAPYDPYLQRVKPPIEQSVEQTSFNVTMDITSKFNEGTSGRLFQGEKVNSYNGRALFRDLNASGINALYHTNSMIYPSSHNLTCANWAVVTTINEPTEAVRKQISLPNWCVVVVGDKKGPFKYDLPSTGGNYIFLSVEMQQELIEMYPLIRSLPWNHFGRKNIGYLYAIHHQARLIYDFDDDNILINKHFFHQFHRSSNPNGNVLRCQEPVNCTDFVLNPYPLLGARQHPIWPRGYPLEYIRSTYYHPVIADVHNNAHKKHENIPSITTTPPLHLTARNISFEAIGIIQLLANHDPDVDAIYRMTQPLPYNFPVDGYLPLLLPKPTGDTHHIYTPYNAQATLHFHTAFWTLYLPISVHGRVSDIWRSYFTQRLVQDFPDTLHILFTSPNVIQERNIHRYLADFNSEIPLYQQSLRLVEQLQSLTLCSTTLPGRMEELYIFLYEHDYLQIEDVFRMQEWIESLIAINYSFPAVPVASTTHCV